MVWPEKIVCIIPVFDLEHDELYPGYVIRLQLLSLGNSKMSQPRNQSASQSVRPSVSQYQYQYQYQYLCNSTQLAKLIKIESRVWLKVQCASPAHAHAHAHPHAQTPVRKPHLRPSFGPLLFK